MAAGDTIYSAASVEEIKVSLAKLAQREASVTSRLEELLASQKDLSRQLSKLDIARAHLGTHVLATRAVSHGMLSSASSTAHRISAAVKALDYEQASVKATLEVVEQVTELKSCVLGVHGSMGGPQDWETAANYLHRASQIPDAVIDGAFAEEIVPTAEVPDTPRVTLETAAESLCGLFLREFEKAAKDGDGARVTRFFKLFPLIGRSDVGLNAYGQYVCAGIAARARNNLSTNQRREGLFYANALTKLFEHIAQIVDGHESLVERHYGVGSMRKVIERIQVEADIQGGIILDTWSEERMVTRKLTDIKSYAFNFLVQSFVAVPKPHALGPRTGSPAPIHSADDDTVDMKDVDSLMGESAVMLGRWSLYTRFLTNKVAAPDLEAVPEIPPFLSNSNLQKKVASLLIEPFNIMATFFFRRSVEKAFQMDEAPAELSLKTNKPISSNPPYITSAVDDVMYIVNQVLRRVLATGQRVVVASVVPSVSRVLGSDFFGMTQRKMRDESYPKPAIQGTMPPENLIVSFLVLMNNIDVSTDYVRRIVTTLTDQTDESAGMTGNFTFEQDVSHVEKSLHSIESSFTLKTTELINEAAEVVLKQVMRPRLRTVLLDTFRDVEYTGSGDEDSGDEQVIEGNAVVQRFERGWQDFTLPIKRLLTEQVYNKLLTITAAHLARMLEKRIWSYYGRLDNLGAIRLERDMAGIVVAASKSGRYELRDVFARCVQMTLIINMEDEEWNEIAKLSGLQLERESGIQWKLDGEERARARALLQDRS